MQSNVTCIINCNHMYLSNPSHICLITCIRSTEKCMLCFVCYIVPLYSIVYLKKCSRMALDGTSYPLLCTLSALCTSVPAECPHVVPVSAISLTLKSFASNRRRSAGTTSPVPKTTYRHGTTQDDAGRRGTTRDDAGWCRMVKSMSDLFFSVQPYHETP